MAVAFDGGVVIGADSRTTMGSYIANRVTDKLTHLSDRIYCCRSGSAADTQALADVVTYHLQLYSVMQEQPPPTAVAAHLFQELIYQNKDRLTAGIIVAGWDKQHGGRVFNVPLGGGVFEQPWAIGGSGSAYIYGFCDASWREGWSKEQTLEFVRNGACASTDISAKSRDAPRWLVGRNDPARGHYRRGRRAPLCAGRPTSRARCQGCIVLRALKVCIDIIGLSGCRYTALGRGARRLGWGLARLEHFTSVILLGGLRALLGRHGSWF